MVGKDKRDPLDRVVKFVSPDEDSFVEVPVYILSMSEKRMQRLKDDYGQDYFNGHDLDKLHFPVTSYKEFSDVAELPERAVRVPHLNRTISQKYRHILKPGVWKYMHWAEISHHISFLSFCFHMLNKGYKRAFFFEDDINFIPVIDNRVFDKTTKKLMQWSDVPNEPDASRARFEWTGKEFQKKLVNTLLAFDASGDAVDLMWLGSAFGTTKFHSYIEAADIEDTHLVVKPTCAVGLHGIMVTNSGARKIIEKTVPIHARTDTSIHYADLEFREITPNLVGQESAALFPLITEIPALFPRSS